MFTRTQSFLQIGIVLILVLLVGLLNAVPVRAETSVIYVKQDANGANNGISWGDAYRALPTAIAAASVGTEIWVAAGTYKPTTGTDRSISFVLKNGVAVYGGFAGTETAAVQRRPKVNCTILSGDIGVTGDNSDNSYHVVVGSNTTNSTILDGFTIIGGNANSEPAILAGGGMYNSNGHPTLTNLIFKDNSAVVGGGGMMNVGSSPNLMNVTFIHNSAEYAGGMANRLYSSPNLVNVTFTNNSADYGGAMLNSDAGSNPILTNVTIAYNSASIEGGGLAISGSLVLRNSILWGNTGGEILNIGPGIPDVSYSLVQGGYTGTGNLDADPKLDSLKDNGGSTQTIALLPGSPAIDAGDDTNCPPTDQRGVSRPQGSHCDIGAYEFIQDTPTFIWNTFQGGVNHDLVAAMIGDNFGNIYVTGSSDSDNWGESPIDPLTGGADAYVAKFDSNGALLWYTFLGAVATSYGYGDNGTGISLDASGNIYVTGASAATWGDAPIRPFIGNENEDVFVAKLNPSGELLWNTFLGGDESDYPFGMAIDKDGNIFVTGRSASSWGDATPAPLDPFVGVPHNDNNAFIAKLSPNGVLQWHTFIGNGSESGMDITTDGQGAIYTTGYGFSSWGNPIRPYTSDDTYVAKFNTDGALQWNTFLGGEGNDIAFGIVLNETNDIFVYGESSTSWGDAPVELGEGGYSDGFIAKLTPNGVLAWNTFIGGDDFDRVSGLAIDPSDNSILISGESQSPWGSFVMAPYNADGNIFLAKLNSSGAAQWNALYGQVPYYNIGSTHLVAIWNHAAYVVGSSLNSWGEPLHPFSSEPNSGYADLYLLKAELPPDPSVTSITRADTNPTNATTVKFTVNFSENVTGVDASDFLVTASGVTNHRIINVTGSGSLYTVTVNTGTGDGTVRLDVVDDDSIKDIANNPLGGLGFGNGNFTTGEVYTINKLANVTVTIGSTGMGTYAVSSNPSLIKNYTGMVDGPVKVVSNSGGNIFASQRAIYGDSFNELMGYPANKFSKEYWFPWYDQIYMQTWILVGNPSATQTAYVDIYIGGTRRADNSGSAHTYIIPPGGNVTPVFPGVLDGPVRVVSVSGPLTASPINIFASERSLFGTSFNEVMGYPLEQFSQEYWFPWYDGIYMKTWILVGNPSASQHAYVDIYINGIKKNSSPYDIPPSGNITPMFPGELNGPVRVVSVSGPLTDTPIDIFTSERSTYGTSFNEVMGYPTEQFATEYWFPWVDQFGSNGMKTWVLVGNPSSTQKAYVDIYIAGVKQGDTRVINPSGNITPTFDITNGPVHVVSVTGDSTPSAIKVFSSERTLYGSSFNEMMGYPGDQLTSEYWFTWYDDIYMKTDVLVGKP